MLHLVAAEAKISKSMDFHESKLLENHVFITRRVDNIKNILLNNFEDLKTTKKMIKTLKTKRLKVLLQFLKILNQIILIFPTLWTITA